MVNFWPTREGGLFRLRTEFQFFRKEDGPKEFVQGKINVWLVDACRKAMVVDGVTWDELIEAAIKSYLTEKGIETE